MSKYARGLVFALENDDEMYGVGVEVPEDTAESEAEMAEINEDARDIEDGIEVTDSSMDDKETLDDMADVMEESVENGEGIDEDTAEVIEIAAEAIYKRLGLRHSKTMPSLESFGSKSTRLQATRVALEDMKEKSAGIGASIMKFIRGIMENLGKLWDKITTFFTKMGMDKRLKALEASIKSVKDGSTKSFETLENKSAAKAFSLKGGDATVADVKKAVDNAITLLANTEKVLGKLDAVADRSLKGLSAKDIETWANIDKDSFSKEVDEAIGGFVSGGENTLYVYGIGFKYETDESGKGKLVKLDRSGEPGEKIANANETHLKSIAQSLQTLKGGLDKITKNGKSKVDAIAKKYEKAAKSIDDKKASDSDAAVKKSLNEARTLIMAQGNLLNAICHHATTIGINTINEGIKYCEACIKAQTAPAEKPEGAA